MHIQDAPSVTRRWTIRRYASDAAYHAGQPTPVRDGNGVVLPPESVIDGNLLLNEGIADALDLIAGLGGTAFSNANSYLGVGDSSAAATAGQTGLQAASNKLYKAMEAGYPQRAGQTLAWRAVFAAGDANYAWNEFTVANGNSDAAVNLNRKVSAQGTKAAGQTWTLDLSITLS